MSNSNKKIKIQASVKNASNESSKKNTEKELSLDELKAKYAVSETEIQKISELIFSKMTFGKTPAKNPVMVIVGGQPGAGKSGLIDKTLSEMPNSVILDVDDFRYFHPQIEEILENYPNDLATFTIKFVNSIFFVVVKKLEDAGYNLIAQKTLKDDEIIYDTLVGLKEMGYGVVVRVLAVSELESKLSALERSLSVKNTVGYCRWTPISNQDYAYKGMVQTSEHIFASPYCDSIQVFKRNEIPTNSDIVYSKSKLESKGLLEKISHENPDLFLGDFGLENYENETDAILKTRDKNTLSGLSDIMTRILIAKRTMDDEGLKYLEELETLATNYYMKLNDYSSEYDHLNNNTKLELAKEIMARKVADACRAGFDPKDPKTAKILEEEAEMNKFNPAVIDKIINVYGKEIKSK